VRLGNARKEVRAIVGVVERGISERDIVLLANIVLKCVWYGSTESVRYRSRLSGPRSGGQFKSGKLEYSSRYSRDLVFEILVWSTTSMDAGDIQARAGEYTETEINS
jgi:hypothetical protein